MKTKILYLLVAFSARGLVAFQNVDINQANLEQLMLLPGVGKILAEKIIKERKLRPISSAEQLGHILGINEARVAPIVAKVSFVVKKPSAVIKNHLPPPSIPKSSMSLSELEKRAMKSWQLEPATEESMLRRARQSAFLPEITLQAEGDKGHDEKEKIPDHKNDGRQVRDILGFGLGLKLRFDFRNAIFSTSEIDILTLSLKRTMARRELLEKLHEDYFRYQHLHNSLPTAAPDARDHMVIDIHRLEAKLNAISDNQFANYPRE